MNYYGLGAKLSSIRFYNKNTIYCPASDCNNIRKGSTFEYPFNNLQSVQHLNMQLPWDFLNRVNPAQTSSNSMIKSYGNKRVK